MEAAAMARPQLTEQEIILCLFNHVRKTKVSLPAVLKREFPILDIYGDQDPPELLRLYADAGASHLYCISPTRKFRLNSSRKCGFGSWELHVDPTPVKDNKGYQIGTGRCFFYASTISFSGRLEYSLREYTLAHKLLAHVDYEYRHYAFYIVTKEDITIGRADKLPSKPNRRFDVHNFLDQIIRSRVIPTTSSSNTVAVVNDAAYRMSFRLSDQEIILYLLNLQGVNRVILPAKFDFEIPVLDVCGDNTPLSMFINHPCNQEIYFLTDEKDWINRRFRRCGEGKWKSDGVEQTVYDEYGEEIGKRNSFYMLYQKSDPSYLLFALRVYSLTDKFLNFSRNEIFADFAFCVVVKVSSKPLATKESSVAVIDSYLDQIQRANAPSDV
ncbi:uncharacterized protein LOC127253021 isoform X1 [Andrographis paniculata]|uniref:uncharacterized protein LOC127253021 isoform X1 n=1 Tax=Andrographis paniculata TaxID=175694 RepID=UPI0021E838BE|nr:uncharacterized protein LOC127253021 isoform X1 [Andrographis paniculata]